MGPRCMVHSHGSNDAGKAILVPLTTSLYVAGALADTDRVIVDVGTGFYVEKVRLDSRLEQQPQLTYPAEHERCHGLLQWKD